MAAVDRNAAALGVPQKQLMESSGNAVAQTVRDVATPGDTVAVVAGRGNNGGDAFVAARFLDDFDLSITLLGRPESISTAIARENWEALQSAEYDTDICHDSTALDLGSPDLVVDAVLGTGASGAPREPERSAIEAINDTDATVVAVDIPSGLDANTGEAVGVAVEADHVVTFHDRKPGLVDHDGVTVADIGIPVAAEEFVGPGDLGVLTRDPQAHKGDFGRMLVIGGGPYTGAPALSAQAALRGGADLAYVAAPEPVADTIQGYSEDLIVEPLTGDRLTPEPVSHLLDRASEMDVVILGPGLGADEETLAAVREFLEGYQGRAVVDAEAIGVVPEVETPATLVFTPHQGELREMGGPSADDWRERAAAVEAFADSLGHTLLVKGAYDVVSDGADTRVNRTGNPGMTVGGTGDVLAGITGALLARLPPLQAAAIAAYANGRAGDVIVDEAGFGLLASDLLAEIPHVLWRER
jgi:NAD(P)H-hydrate epimerase